MLTTVRQQGGRDSPTGLDILIGGLSGTRHTPGRPPAVGAPPSPGENGRCINEKTAVGLIVGAHRPTLQLKVMRPQDLTF